MTDWMGTKSRGEGYGFAPRRLRSRTAGSSGSIAGAMPCLLLQVRQDLPLHKLILLLLGIMAVVAVGFLVVQRVKRAYQTEDRPADGTVGFTLSDLRDLHKSGQMSDEEFEKAKAKVIDAAKRAAERDASAKAEREARGSKDL